APPRLEPSGEVPMSGTQTWSRDFVGSTRREPAELREGRLAQLRSRSLNLVDTERWYLVMLAHVQRASQREAPWLDGWWLLCWPVRYCQPRGRSRTRMS